MDDPQTMMEMTVVKEEIKGEPDDSMENDGKNGLWDVPSQRADMAFAVVNEENDSEEEDVKPPLTVFLSPEQQQDEYLQEKDPLSLDSLCKDILVDSKSLTMQETESHAGEKKNNERRGDQSFPANEVRSPAERILGVDCDFRPEVQVKEMERDEVARNCEAFECKICNKLLASISGLMRHINIHKGEKSYESSVVSSWLQSLKHSTSYHTRLNCPVCGRYCAGKAGLNIHMNIHTMQKPYKCKDCGMEFSTEYILKRHKRTHPGGSCKCSICEKEFKSLPHFSENIEITHTGERPYACSTCGKRFSRQKNLVTHSESHSGDTPFDSSSCGKRYPPESSLVAHNNIHSGERQILWEVGSGNFQCKYCGKCFKDQYRLNKHWKMHHVKCNICQREYKDLGNLSKHMRVHTGDGEYACDICGRRFWYKRNLVLHRRMHSM